MNDRLAVSDRQAVSERFIELVLADPDLLDAAVAALEAAWSADPPFRRPTVATRARRPVGRIPVGRPRRPGRPRDHERVGPTWLRCTARSPPGRLGWD